MATPQTKILKPYWDVEEEEEEDLAEDYRNSGRDAILICIDGSKSMQASRTDEDGQPAASYFHGALECATNLVKRKALVSPYDMFGILLYNTMTGDAEAGDSGVRILLPLGPITLEAIRDLKEHVNSSATDPEYLPLTFPPMNTITSPAVIFESAGLEMRASAVKVGSRRVFLVTDDDNPSRHIEDERARRQQENVSRTRSRDLSQLGVSILTFFLQSDEERFDAETYWNRILPSDSLPAPTSNWEQDDETQLPPANSGLVRFEELQEQMSVRLSAKRALWTTDLVLGEGLVIGVKGYGLFTEAKRSPPQYVYAEGRQTELVEQRTDYYDAEDQSARKAFPEEQIRQTFDFSAVGGSVAPPKPQYGDGTTPAPGAVKDEDGSDEEDQSQRQVGTSAAAAGVKHDQVKEEPASIMSSLTGKGIEKPLQWKRKKKITFTRDEIRTFKNGGLEPGIHIIGFQDSSTLEWKHNIKLPYFIYPTEERYIGSTRTFAALLRSLLDKDKIGIARCVYRKGNSPSICALVPQEETFVEGTGAQDKAPGFYLIPFCFVDDMRESPQRIIDSKKNAIIEADTSHVVNMQRIIKRLSSSTAYIPEQYPNPNLARYNAQLEALAFDEPWDDEIAARTIEDKTQPLYEIMHKRASKYMLAWKECINMDESTHEPVPKSTKKRKGDGHDGDDDDAPKRKAPKPTEIDTVEVREHWKEGTLKQIKVEQLKTFLRSVSRQPVGKALKGDCIEAVEKYFEEGGDRV